MWVVRKRILNAKDATRAVISSEPTLTTANLFRPAAIVV